jgi:16S rRNA processing protein RimM
VSTTRVSKWEEMVLVGKVARAHGRFGEVIVNPETDFPAERFAPGSVVHALRSGREEQLKVNAMRMHLGRPLLAFDGVDTMSDAEALAGVELRVPERDLTPLPEGTYYEHTLVGCDVVTVSGRRLGAVAKVEGRAGGARLIVGSGRDEIQIPLAHHICVSIDVASRQIVVDPPEGLLELNS